MKRNAPSVSGTNRILPYEVLFLVLFAMYLFVPVRIGDDSWFLTSLLTAYRGDLFGFLAFRYETWSTRLLLEAYTLLLLYFPALYRISMTLWFVMIAAGFIRILEIQDNRQKWTICFSMLLIPIAFNWDAGFVCTSVNYVFSLVCYLWAVIPLLDAWKGKDVPVWKYVVSAILLIFACNMEYYCPPFLLLGIWFFIGSMKRKQGRIYSGIMLLIVILSLIFAFASPASTVSAYGESDEIFVGYDSYGTIEKLQMGFVSTAGGIVSRSRYGDSFLIAALVFGVLLLLYGLEQKKVWIRMVSGLWLAITAVTGGLARFLPEEMLFRTLFYDLEAGWKWDSTAALVLSFVFFGCMLFFLFRMNRVLGWCAALALFNRITMGASSSVFASGLRTFYPMLFVICIGCGVLAGRIRKYSVIANTVFWSGAVITYIMNFILLM